ncbi:uncharacterized protein MYCFIDRAFT_179104 [Pseudocercospora fijiensis CIRAD86]|uniref:Uncharacterized protein n=1 Tax=Pseudocercospora fijiensis (strain CIRAD86) TaxID=383855 RepID=M3AJC9_PSEFD|nr:uncharacterized protein MYCFIDRAFT_179104 [Pseudocercospora fijiensis CIRAD86]EME77587.1 hypothetical protein MYCFIDRAFT_179104 [Pseudocercospora fijiensis CIRAD86]
MREGDLLSGSGISLTSFAICPSQTSLGTDPDLVTMQRQAHSLSHASRAWNDQSLEIIPVRYHQPIPAKTDTIQPRRRVLRTASVAMMRRSPMDGLSLMRYVRGHPYERNWLEWTAFISTCRDPSPHANDRRFLSPAERGCCYLHDTAMQVNVARPVRRS